MFGFGKKHRKAALPESDQSAAAEPSIESGGAGASDPAAVASSAQIERGVARVSPDPIGVAQLMPTAEPVHAEPVEAEPRAKRGGWFRSKPRAGEAETPLPPPAVEARATEPRVAPAPARIQEEPTEKKSGVFSRLRERLTRTRETLGDGLGTLFIGRKRIDDDLMEELETLLLTADVGVPTTARIMEDLASRVKRKSLADPQALLRALKGELRSVLQAADAPVRQPAPGRPQVILMVGVNGAGKTTTIGKLAKRLQEEGNSVILAAGDTFRAAAVEQLQTWGERNRVSVVAQQTGADSASVIFDALQAATARGADVLIADTAGRLHTKSNLMEELAKVARVMKKIDPEAPHEVMLVVDATTGQNALSQATHFHQAIGLTGITLTKLDGTAKGGILFAIADRLKVPIRFIGVGETIDDLRPFDADEFLDALLS
ncbi:signal recognition particle-docking protein FtsY [Thiocapsa sp.]|uniref:signal recognition particle-docking protein FtsY n=1 Tax=Thiocapsa sp. TaxID=2024551 RepID=UPI002CA05CE0|nr:signal recognition particle-docking protein FtsY [Thiocapsa sp.]HSO84448.1 signal recognition particle-docking protein FtsY [Thiocapsa sp.]